MGVKNTRLTRVLACVQVEDVDDVVDVDHLLAVRHGLGEPEAGRVLQRLAQRQVREEDVLLQHVTDAPLPPLREALPVQADAARVQLGAARQAVQEGGLATTCGKRRMRVQEFVSKLFRGERRGGGGGHHNEFVELNS